MNEKMLAYMLKETESAVRMMARDKKPIHVFDYGTTAQGEKHVVLIAILPEKLLPPIVLVPSEPLQDDIDAEAAEIQQYFHSPAKEARP